VGRRRRERSGRLERRAPTSRLLGQQLEVRIERARHVVDLRGAVVVAHPPTAERRRAEPFGVASELREWSSGERPEEIADQPGAEREGDADHDRPPAQVGGLVVGVAERGDELYERPIADLGHVEHLDRVEPPVLAVG
jgi:hypothetical protein